jgi:glycosyltransferase involved in cell wall biosynthesis
MPEQILYLSYDGLTDPLGQSQILPYLTQLSRRGYHITIISAEKKENFTVRQKLIRSSIAPYSITWKPLFYTKKPPVLSTLWDIRQMQQTAFRLHRQTPFQLVHCRSYITALVGLALKKQTGIPFVFDMRGFWADERIEGGLWKLTNPVFKQVYGYFKRREKEFLRQADYTISLTYAAKDEIKSWPGLSQTPIQVIPCCVDTTLFTPIPPPATTQFTISYLGSLGTWYMLDEMLLFFKRLLQQRPNSYFLFITPDAPNLILTKADALNINRDRFIITRAERKEVPKLLAQSQLSLFFVRPTYSKKASSPTKMGEILSMGIPIVCNAGVGDTDYLMQHYKVGGLVQNFTEKAYDQVIAQVDQYLAIDPIHLRAVAQDYFDLTKGVDLYQEVYERLLH